MAFQSEPEMALLFCFIACCWVNPVAAVECTTAIVASVFGTIGAVLLIAAIAAIVWYYCKRKTSGDALSFAGRQFYESCIFNLFKSV